MGIDTSWPGRSTIRRRMRSSPRMRFCGGPTEAQAIPGVEIVRAYLGENSPLLADFDVVFSISVVEHVEDLDAFHADQLRILKPGGIFIHAIDLYLGEGADTSRFDAYR